MQLYFKHYLKHCVKYLGIIVASLSATACGVYHTKHDVDPAINTSRHAIPEPRYPSDQQYNNTQDRQWPDNAESPYKTDNNSYDNTNPSLVHGSNNEESVAILEPQKPISSPPPLVERLVSKARAQLNEQAYQQAITTAERGLRVERKEPRFYWLLSQAYIGLNNREQATLFAKQGLRYAPKNSGIYFDLQSLAR